MRVEHLADGVTLYLGDCREILPTLGMVDVCLTDPPYGCLKADWDYEFPTGWYALAQSRMTVIMTGSSGLADSIPLVAGDFIDVISARNLNGMTRGPLGFGNWLAAVVAKSKPKQGVNAFEFSISAEKPAHPCPKPLPYMIKLVSRVTDFGETVLDPFMGSGTTGVACARLGRQFTGVEIEPKYFDIACRRISDELGRPRLFREAPQKTKQEALL